LKAGDFGHSCCQRLSLSTTLGIGSRMTVNRKEHLDIYSGFTMPVPAQAQSPAKMEYMLDSASTERL
jgi:hypothetical protein